MRGTWTIAHVIVLLAALLFFLALLAALNTGPLTNPVAWIAAGLLALAISALPWRATTP